MQLDFKSVPLGLCFLLDGVVYFNLASFHLVCIAWNGGSRYIYKISPHPHLAAELIKGNAESKDGCVSTNY